MLRPMLKYVLLALVVAIAVLIWQAGARRARGRDRRPPPAEQPPQKMVRCAECAVYLPEAEALAADGRHFCCAAHEAAFAGRRRG